MHPQLQAIVDDFGRAETRLHRLAAALSPHWNRRPDPAPHRWIISPFDPRIHSGAYACLTIPPAHQHRHRWQAEQVRAALPTA